MQLAPADLRSHCCCACVSPSSDLSGSFSSVNNFSSAHSENSSSSSSVRAASGRARLTSTAQHRRALGRGFFLMTFLVAKHPSRAAAAQKDDSPLRIVRSPSSGPLSTATCYDKQDELVR